MFAPAFWQKGGWCVIVKFLLAGFIELVKVIDSLCKIRILLEVKWHVPKQLWCIFSHLPIIGAHKAQVTSVTEMFGLTCFQKFFQAFFGSDFENFCTHVFVFN